MHKCASKHISTKNFSTKIARNSCCELANMSKSLHLVLFMLKKKKCNLCWNKYVFYLWRKLKQSPPLGRSYECQSILVVLSLKLEHPSKLESFTRSLVCSPCTWNFPRVLYPLCELILFLWNWNTFLIAKSVLQLKLLRIE